MGRYKYIDLAIDEHGCSESETLIDNIISDVIENINNGRSMLLDSINGEHPSKWLIDAINYSFDTAIENIKG